MPISGVTVLAAPEKVASVRARLETELEAEIAEIVDNYLVVVLEAETDKAMKNKFESIFSMPGVVTAQMAYYDAETIE